MTDNILDCIEFGIKYSKSPFTLLHYYAFTELDPQELSTYASKKRRNSLAVGIRNFGQKATKYAKKLDEEKVQCCNFGNNERVLTKEELNIIYEKMKYEGYPLLDVVFFEACKRYFLSGIDAISKQNVRKEIIAIRNKTLNKTKKLTLKDK